MPLLERSVDEVMRTWPDAIGVFLRLQPRCIGCPIGRFHTVAEACAVHGVDVRRFASALTEAIETGRRG